MKGYNVVTYLKLNPFTTKNHVSCFQQGIRSQQKIMYLASKFSL